MVSREEGSNFAQRRRGGIKKEWDVAKAKKKYICAQHSLLYKNKRSRRKVGYSKC